MKSNTRNPFDTPPKAVSDADKKAFESAYRLYKNHLFRIILKVTGDYHLAQDILQELWVYVYYKYKPTEYHNLSNLRWKAKRMAIDALRVRKRKPGNYATHIEADTVIDPPRESELTLAQDQQMMRAFFEELGVLGLTEVQKQALWEHERHGYTLSQLEPVPKTLIFAVWGRDRIFKQGFSFAGCGFTLDL